MVSKEEWAEWLRQCLLEIPAATLLEQHDVFSCLLATVSGGKLDKTIDEFMANGDHGFQHSIKVAKACQDILEACPTIGAEVALACPPTLFEFAAVAHDLSRAFGCTTDTHEEASAVLAVEILKVAGHPQSDRDLLYVMLRYHDYFNFVVDGDEPPTIMYNNMAAVVFRLADFVSEETAANEVRRFYDAGIRYGTPFFNPELTDEVRFAFSTNYEQRDMVTWFCVLLALQPEDFYYTELEEYYREWAENKTETLIATLPELIADYREQPGVVPIKDPENIASDVTAVIARFNVWLMAQKN